MAPRITLLVFFALISVFSQAAESAREYFKFAKFSYDAGDYYKALNFIDQAIILEPDYISSFILRAEIFMKLGNYQAVIDDAGKVLTTGQAMTALSSQAFLLRAKAHFYLKNLSVALLDVKACIALDAANPEAYFYNGRILSQNNSLFQALENFDIAIKYDAQQAEYFYFRAQTKADLFKALPGTPTYDEIMTDLEHAQSLDNEDHRSYALKCKMLKMNAEHQKEIYLAELDKTIGLFPEKAEFYSQRGMAKVLDFQFAAALTDFTKAIVIAGPDESLLRNRALCYHNLGNFPAALIDYGVSIDMMIKKFQNEEGKSTKSTLAETMVMRGRTFEASGMPDDACDDFYNAAKLGSKNGLNNYRRNCNVYN